MLLVQDYLTSHTFGDLARDHGVYVSFSKSGHKFSLNYDQIEAKEHDPLAQECRGLVLACENGTSLASQSITVPGKKASYDHLSPGKTRILAYPMKRFFNHGQGSAAEINWSDPQLKVLEKLDGTLCIVYFDPFTEQWCVATRSVPEADLIMDNNLFTFRTLFEKATQETTGMTFDELTAGLDKYFTYCFELTTPYNRIVVYYPNNGITLLSARNLLTLSESELEGLPLDGRIPKVQAHSYTTIPALVEWVSSLNPMEHEGVVVRDAKFNRIKLKNPSYVAYNKVRDALASSERNIVEIILAEKDDDVIPMLPEEIVKNLQKIKVGLVKVIQDHDLAFRTIYNECQIIKAGDKKIFAIAVQGVAKLRNGKLWTAPLFNMFDNRSVDMKDFIQKNRKDGTWGNSFLDKILEIAKFYY
jgi:hypothetical protein